MGENQVKRILVVDDDEYTAKAVQRELNSPPFLRYRYTVEIFTDPVKALERARESDFDVVISDYRMPGMNGLEFLKALAGVQPVCVRLVLSGHTDMDALVRMLNESHIYRFIPKPWNNHFLKSAVSQGLDYSDLLSEYRRLADLVRANPILALPVPERETDHILIVDDDPSVLSSLSRMLTVHSQTDDIFAEIFSEAMAAGGAPASLHEELIRVHLAPSPEQALKMAEDMAFSCVLADCRMPGMNGIDLLHKFFELQPDCARILISGQIDEADLIRAIDSAHIFAFIDKPWTDFEVKAQIALALSRRRILRENRRLAEMVRTSAPSA
jgi:DNA-binding NtrC family response regulator